MINNIKTIHAEHDAINKLPTNNKRLKSVNILVIRISNTGILGMSKPCENCIKLMNTLPQQKGYKINKVFYSDSFGIIIKTTLNKLMNENNNHVSKFYKRLENINNK